MYEFRRVITIGAARPHTPTWEQETHRVVFWVPVPERRQRRDLSRVSEVPDVQARELAAIRDGVIRENGFNFCIGMGATREDIDFVLRDIWQRQVIESLGELPREIEFRGSTVESGAPCVTL